MICDTAGLFRKSERALPRALLRRSADAVECLPGHVADSERGVVLSDIVQAELCDMAVPIEEMLELADRGFALQHAPA